MMNVFFGWNVIIILTSRKEAFRVMVFGYSVIAAMYLMVFAAILGGAAFANR